ncbi:hypothetical protein LDENG_00205470 [Lucifuga dentata]|nr:hypothetical protein LDENG_00205470 [Lucifuga dentata]
MPGSNQSNQQLVRQSLAGNIRQWHASSSGWQPMEYAQNVGTWIRAHVDARKLPKERASKDTPTNRRLYRESVYGILWQLLVLYHITEAMQAQGSTSSQPSFDSLSSSDSLFFSDLEQAEDDADVFLTDISSSVITDGAGGATTDGNGVSESPGFQWACDGFSEKEKEEESERLESSGKGTHNGVVRETDPTSQSPQSQGDLLFAQKCAELQGFVRPLLELLNGLKRGRFERGLSSFQQSVAMDRIQRIVGVLQRPNIGGKYLNILLQVEMMLKLWFPQVPTCPVSAASSTAMSPACSVQHTSSSSTPPHKHRDQLHIPVKKRRLSWTGTDSATPSPVLKCPRTSREEKGEKQEEVGRESPPASMASASRNPKNTASDSQLNEDTKPESVVIQLHKTAPSPLPHPTSSQKS